MPQIYQMNYLKYGWFAEEVKSDLFGLEPFEQFIKLHEHFQDVILSLFNVPYETIEEAEFACVKHGGLSYTETQDMPFYKLSRWIKKINSENEKQKEAEEKEQAKYNMKDMNPKSMMKTAQKQSNFKQPKMPKIK